MIMIILVIEKLCVTVCVCVCVCGYGVMPVVLPHQWEELQLFIAYPILCTLVIGVCVFVHVCVCVVCECLVVQSGDPMDSCTIIVHHSLG